MPALLESVKQADADRQDPMFLGATPPLSSGKVSRFARMRLRNIRERKQLGSVRAGPVPSVQLTID